MIMTENSATSITVHGVATMQVKIFSGNNFSSTEKDLNEWLLYNQVIVHHIGQSQCERNGNLLVAISVFYILKNNKNN
jgi:hypothetical protein